jgi:hypothetical protein
MVLYLFAIKRDGISSHLYLLLCAVIIFCKFFRTLVRYFVSTRKYTIPLERIFLQNSLLGLSGKKTCIRFPSTLSTIRTSPTLYSVVLSSFFSLILPTVFWLRVYYHCYFVKPISRMVYIYQIPYRNYFSLPANVFFIFGYTCHFGDVSFYLAVLFVNSFHVFMRSFPINNFLL